MLIPQGLAYASLATLPPVYGLYSSIVAMLVYPLFGTSPELAVGPTALMSLLTAGVMTELGTDDGVEGESRRLEIALRLAFIMGVIQLAMGLFNAGVLVRFLSHPMLRYVFCSSASQFGYIIAQIYPTVASLVLLPSSLRPVSWASCSSSS